MVLFVLFGYIVLILLYIDFVPFFDGGTFFSDLIGATNNTQLDLFKYSSLGHPSILYFFYSSLWQKINPGNSQLLHLGNLILGIMAIFCFKQIANILVPKKMEFEKIIATSIFAFFPVFTISTLNFNLDFGLTCFYILFLFLLLTKKSPALIALSGLFLLFTKEPGIVLYSLSILFYFLLDVLYGRKIMLNSSKFFNGMLLLFPEIAYISYVFYKENVLKLAANWGAQGELANFIKGLINPDFHHLTFITYNLGIFVVSFNWLITITIFAWSILFLVSAFIKKDIVKIRSHSEQKNIIFLILSFIIFWYVFTSYKHFVNLRYFLPLNVLLIFIFLSTIFSIKHILVRRIIMVVVFTLIFLSNFQTIDPLTKKTFGTFKFGNHEMLYITSVTNELPPYGRDQIVYNLQAAQLHYLLNDAFAYIKPKANTSFLTYQWTDWGNIYSQLDNNSYRRTFLSKNTFRPNYIPYYINEKQSQIINLDPKPKVLYYIDIPFFRDSKKTLYSLVSLLAENGFFYKIDRTIIKNKLGYSLDIYKLTLAD